MSSHKTHNTNTDSPAVCVLLFFPSQFLTFSFSDGCSQSMFIIGDELKFYNILTCQRSNIKGDSTAAKKQV